MTSSTSPSTSLLQLLWHRTSPSNLSSNGGPMRGFRKGSDTSSPRAWRDVSHVSRVDVSTWRVSSRRLRPWLWPRRFGDRRNPRNRRSLRRSVAIAPPLPSSWHTTKPDMRPKRRWLLMWLPCGLSAVFWRPGPCWFEKTTTWWPLVATGGYVIETVACWDFLCAIPPQRAV